MDQNGSNLDFSPIKKCKYERQSYLSGNYTWPTFLEQMRSKWTRSDKSVQNGSKWIKMDQTGSNLDFSTIKNVGFKI